MEELNQLIKGFKVLTSYDKRKELLQKKMPDFVESDRWYGTG